MARVTHLPLPVLVLLTALGAPVHAQDPLAPPGRQVVEADGYLAEVTYSSQRVQVRVYDLSGEPIDLRGLWLRRCAVEIATRRGDNEQSASRKVTLVEPGDGGLPYLEARHQLGQLIDQDHLVVCVRLKNLDGRGDRTVRLWAEWQRVSGCFQGCSPGVECRQTRDRACRLCQRRLCRPRRD